MTTRRGLASLSPASERPERRKHRTNAGHAGECASESSLKTEEKIERQCGQHGAEGLRAVGSLELSVNS